MSLRNERRLKMNKVCAECGKQLKNESCSFYDKLTHRWIMFCKNDSCYKLYTPEHKFKTGCIERRYCAYCGEAVGSSEYLSQGARFFCDMPHFDLYIQNRFKSKKGG